MPRYTLSHQLRLDIRNYEDFGFNGPEQLEVIGYKTDDISLLAYPNLYNYLNKYYNWYCDKNKIELVFTVDEKTFKDNSYLAYTVHQIDRYSDKHYIGFGEIIISDTELPDFKKYV